MVWYLTFFWVKTHFCKLEMQFKHRLGFNTNRWPTFWIPELVCVETSAMTRTGLFTLITGAVCARLCESRRVTLFTSRECALYTKLFRNVRGYRIRHVGTSTCACGCVRVPLWRHTSFRHARACVCVRRRSSQCYIFVTLTASHVARLDVLYIIMPSSRLH